MRNLGVCILLLSVLPLSAQGVDLPAVHMPAVEMPRVEMPSVAMPGERLPTTPNDGVVQDANGSPMGRWARSVVPGRIQLYDVNGIPGPQLERHVDGQWRTVPHMSEGGPWKLDTGTGALQQIP